MVGWEWIRGSSWKWNCPCSNESCKEICLLDMNQPINPRTYKPAKNNIRKHYHQENDESWQYYFYWRPIWDLDMLQWRPTCMIGHLKILQRRQICLIRDLCILHCRHKSIQRQTCLIEESSEFKHKYLNCTGIYSINDYFRWNQERTLFRHVNLLLVCYQASWSPTARLSGTYDSHWSGIRHVGLWWSMLVSNKACWGLRWVKIRHVRLQ